MLRKQGTRTLSAFSDALAQPARPQPEMVDGMLIGWPPALVILPGFVKRRAGAVPAVARPPARGSAAGFCAARPRAARRR